MTRNVGSYPEGLPRGVTQGGYPRGLLREVTQAGYPERLLRVVTQEDYLGMWGVTQKNYSGRLPKEVT